MCIRDSHLQGAIALELGDQQHPLARYLWNSGYGEGWALYSERLADELGLYPTPPVSYTHLTLPTIYSV